MRNEIVVGLDGSPSTKPALNWAVEQAKNVGASGVMDPVGCPQRDEADVLPAPHGATGHCGARTTSGAGRVGPGLRDRIRHARD